MNLIGAVAETLFLARRAELGNLDGRQQPLSRLLWIVDHLCKTANSVYLGVLIKAVKNMVVGEALMF